jgi:hypothetical protein
MVGELTEVPLSRKQCEPLVVAPNEMAEIVKQTPVQAEAPEERATISPQRLLRILGVTKVVLAEARRLAPEPGSLDHLRRMHDQICHELECSLPIDLYEELSELTPDLESASLEELVLAHAEIVGWLEGLFQGVRVALAEANVQPAQPEELKQPERHDPRYL